MDENTNMSIRKFLKQVGVTSQQAIEEALRGAGDTSGKSFGVEIVLKIEALDLVHHVSGKIDGGA